MKTYILLYLFTIKKFKKNILIKNNNVNIELNNDINSELNNNNKLKSGNNDADQNEENLDAFIYKYNENRYKYNILKTLENDKVSILTKISKINEYNSNSNSKYISTLSNSKLLDEWNFDINTKESKHSEDYKDNY